MPHKAKRKSNVGRHSASANASREKRSRDSDDSREERLESMRLIIGERMRQMREGRRG